MSIWHLKQKEKNIFSLYCPFKYNRITALSNILKGAA